MEVVNTMENKLFNMMGSEVVSGFTCKPVKLVPNKPIMHFKTHIFICTDERCGGAHKNENIATDLRDILKEIGLANAETRIKISRTGCFGACRFRSTANIFENTRMNGYEPNNNIWLRNIHKYSKEKWIELFKALAENKNIDDLDFQQIPMSEPSTYK
jgi:(2Fe-2S) ferredoxin